MKNMMRRIAALVLCMLMVFSCGSAVFAASEDKSAAEALKEILQAEDDPNAEVKEIADLYTGSDLALLEGRLREWQQSGVKPDAPNLSLVCDENVGKLVTIRFDKQTYTYYMMRNKDGVWCVIGEDGDLSKKFARYTAYTGVKHPAMYCNSGYVKQYKRDLSEYYLFDDTAEECYVMRLGRDKFYRSEEMIDNWYTYWTTHAHREYGYRYPNSGFVCLDSFGIYSGLKEYHPRVWLDVLIWGGIIGGILLLIGLVIWLLRRSKEGSASWVEKIPLTWRMLTGATRYIK